MNLIRLTGAVILITFFCSSNNTYGTTNGATVKDRFVGTWELELIEIQKLNGE